MTIAFCINSTAMMGLGPTLSSLIRNCAESAALNIFFLCGELQENDQLNISNLLVREGFKGKFQFIDFNPQEIFGTFRSLHGDWTTYGRFLLPELLNASRVLYLDADLIIETDLLMLEDFDFGGHALAAVSANRVKHALDRPFLNGKLQVPMDNSYFNAGVLYFDLDSWRLNDYKETCLSLARTYPDELISHDQTLLNAIFSDRFTRLDKRYNCAWYAHASRPKTADKMILHFLGSPKPWDPGASFIHNGYETWKKHLDPEWGKAYHHLNIRRAWNIRRSYLRVIRKRFKKNA